MRIGGFGTESTTGIGKPKGSAQKGINDLQAGDKFKATILDIKRGEVTIKLTDGNVITAKSMVVPEARIGDVMEFSVQDNKDGQILLSMFSSTDGKELQMRTLVDILSSVNILPTEESLELVKLLMDNGLPVDKNTIQNLLQSLKANPDLDMDTLAFMLKEDIPITLENIEQVKLTVQNENKIKNQITELAYKIAGIDEPSIKQQVLSIFLPELSEQNIDELKNFATIEQSNLTSNIELAGKKIIFNEAVDFMKDNVLQDKELMSEISNAMQTQGDIKEIINMISTKYPERAELFNMLNEDENLGTVFKEFLNKLMEFEGTSKEIPKAELLSKAIEQSLFIDIKNKNTPEELNKYYQQLHDKIIKSLEITQKGSTENTIETTKTLSEIKENIEFMNNINKFQEFIQIPFRIGDTNNQGDLYVFSDKKGKKISKDTASVLVALDLVVLGHFEVFIQKNFKNISCQFRTMDKKVQSLVQININKLHTALKQKGYNLTQIAYKTIDEPFNILKEPKDLGVETVNTETQTAKRYSFDMRA